MLGCWQPGWPPNSPSPSAVSGVPAERGRILPRPMEFSGRVSVFLSLQTIAFSHQGHRSWGKSSLRGLEARSVAARHSTQWLASSLENLRWDEKAGILR